MRKYLSVNILDKGVRNLRSSVRKCYRVSELIGAPFVRLESASEVEMSLVKEG